MAALFERAWDGRELLIEMRIFLYSTLEHFYAVSTICAVLKHYYVFFYIFPATKFKVLSLSNLYKLEVSIFI